MSPGVKLVIPVKYANDQMNCEFTFDYQCQADYFSNPEHGYWDLIDHKGLRTDQLRFIPSSGYPIFFKGAPSKSTKPLLGLLPGTQLLRTNCPYDLRKERHHNWQTRQIDITDYFSSKELLLPAIMNTSAEVTNVPIGTKKIVIKPQIVNVSDKKADVDPQLLAATINEIMELTGYDLLNALKFYNTFIKSSE